MQKLRSVILLVFTAIGISAFVFIFQIVAQLNLSPDDSSALYGGILETGYPSAGFLTSYRDQTVAACGYAVLNPSLAITASHCVDDSNAIYLGKGKYTINKFQTTKVEKAIQKEGWVNEKKRIDDFAILKLEPNNYFSEFAQIASPVVGCNYRLVAYGRTENPDELINPPRKSAAICVLTVSENIVTIQGRNSGICFGDSGSPVYFEGTNKVIGVIASIINPENKASNPCDFDNTAVVVRADANLRLITQNINTSNTNNNIEIVDGTTIAVTQSTVLEKVGLGRLENLDQKGTYSFILNATVVGIIVLGVGIIFIFLSPNRKKDPLTNISLEG